MEKILLAVDAINPSYTALDFACYLAKVTRSKVTAAFLENLLQEERSLLQEHSGDALIDQKEKLIEENISRYKNACINREVNLNLARDPGLPPVELLKESRFADVIIIDPTTTFTKQYEGTPSRFVKDILSHSECPVIIAPESFESIDELVFSYDGSAASVFAIKQFTYLFPQFRDKKLKIVQVSMEEGSNPPDKHLLNTWLQVHYNDIHFEILNGKVETELFEYVFKKKNVFIIMGSFGRSTFSRFFKHSYAELLIKTTTQPIFIAHP